jgi:predicted dehydrogenase
MTRRIIKLAQIAYMSEWALAKFFESLKSDGIPDRFRLGAVCGQEPNRENAIDNLRKGIETRLNSLAKSGFRQGNRRYEIVNCVGLIDYLRERSIKYFRVNGNDSLPPQIYKLGIDAVVIHSLNTSHLGYITDAHAHGIHVLCEKPLVPVLVRGNRPYDGDLARLEDLASKTPEGLVMMDAEHYSYKLPSLVFYENLEEILKGRRIVNVEGEIKETDNPYLPRTQDILSLKNCTGILGDTMCHLLAFISNLGGKAKPIKRVYDEFKDKKVQYHTDTYDHVDFEIEDLGTGYFAKDAKASFKVGKFADRFAEPAKKESKFIRFVLEDESEIILDFKAGAIRSRRGCEEMDYSFRYQIDRNEYVNILHAFYASIINKTQPRTSFRRSALTLRAILESYRLPEDVNVCGGIYPAFVG